MRKYPPASILAELNRLGFENRFTSKHWHRRGNMWEIAASGETLVRIWLVDDQYRIEFFKMYNVTYIDFS